VPGLLRWTGRIKPGQTSDEPVCGVDVLPTMCELAGIERPKDRAIDGASFVPVFTGKPIARQTPLYWHFNIAQSAPKVAMRVGDWKLLGKLNLPDIKPGAHITKERQETIKSAELAGFELYNLREDIGEKRDLAATETERVKEMSAQMQKLYRQVRDESPTWPEWQWPRYEAERIEWPKYFKKK
jgi:arylsulfatase A